MPKSPEVWVVNMSTKRISLEPMRRTGDRYYVQNDMDGQPAYVTVKDVDSQIQNFNEYGIGWTRCTTDSNVYLASGQDQCLKLIQGLIDNYKNAIFNLNKILQAYDLNDDSLLNVLRDNVYGVRVERGKESATNVHIGYIERSYSDNAGDWESGQFTGLLCNAKMVIGDDIGKEHTVLVNIGTRGINVYLQLEPLSQLIETYHGLPQVCNELSELWSVNSHFGLQFTHWVPNKFEHRHFSNVPYYYLPKGYQYQDVERLIRRQFSRLLGIKSRTAKHKKSSDTIRQFVVSPVAASTIADVHQKRNHLVMEYSTANNPMDDGKYYGLSKLPIVLCHQRPDGSIYIKVSVEPEHIIKLTQKAYQDVAVQKHSVLDAILET